MTGLCTVVATQPAAASLQLVPCLGEDAASPLPEARLACLLVAGLSRCQGAGAAFPGASPMEVVDCFHPFAPPDGVDVPAALLAVCCPCFAPIAGGGLAGGCCLMTSRCVAPMLVYLGSLFDTAGMSAGPTGAGERRSKAGGSDGRFMSSRKLTVTERPLAQRG